MFKLLDIFIGSFAIVKASADMKMPVEVHGFIRVISNDDESKYLAFVVDNKMSKELIESEEIEFLKAEAIHRTQESVYDEFD